jgi:hypothetical protein
MKRKFTGIGAIALVAMATFGATSASAATEFGDNCIADEAVAAPFTFFALTANENPMPLTAPTGGVISKWKSNLIPVPATVPQTLKVLRQTGPNTVQIIGESSGNVVGGSNTFNTRIPVQAGDRLGLFGSGPLGALVCEEGVGPNLIGVYEGAGSVNQTVPFFTFTETWRIPVAAVIEPDADNDGFGDETQDQCPQLATLQTPCPPVTVDASGTAKKGLVSILVTVTSQAPVSVSGTVKLGKGKTVKLRGGTQIVTPGALSRFTLLFPKALRDKLKALSTKRGLWLNAVATATDLAGRVSTDVVNLKLRGQKKPPRKKAKAKG